MKCFLNFCNFMLFINHFFCIFPFRLSVDGKEKLQFSTNRRWYIFRMVLINAVVGLFQGLVLYASPSSKSLADLTFLCSGIYAWFTVVFIQLNSLRIKDKLRNALERLQRSLKSRDFEQLKTCSSKTALACEMGSMLFAVLHFLVIGAKYYGGFATAAGVFGYFVPKYLAVMSSYTFVRFVMALRVLFGNLNEAIQKRGIGQKEIENLTKQHLILRGLTKKISHLYCVQNLLVLVQFKLLLIFQVYQIVVVHFRAPLTENNVKVLYVSYFLVLKFLVASVVLLVNCTATRNEANMFGPLKCSASLKANQEDRMTFSFKLATEGVSFSGGGWFEMDYVFLINMLGNVLVYTIILTQFSTQLPHQLILGGDNN